MGALRRIQDIDPQELLGTYRRFGIAGPPYEVIGVSRRLQNGDAEMIVRVVESEEEVVYNLSDLIDDPVEE